MARKVRFALKLKDDYEARQGIEEIREHFDLEKVLGYLHDGRLVQWLKAHHAEKEADELTKIDQNAKDLPQKVCAVLGVKIGTVVEKVDSQKIFERASKRQKLEQYTTDKNILAKSEFVAFDDDDLRELIKKGAKEIILCGSHEFSIPLNKKNIHYIGMGGAKVFFNKKLWPDFTIRNIHFTNLEVNEKYQNVQSTRRVRKIRYTAPVQYNSIIDLLLSYLEC